MRIDPPFTGTAAAFYSFTHSPTRLEIADLEQSVSSVGVISPVEFEDSCSSELIAPPIEVVSSESLRSFLGEFLPRARRASFFEKDRLLANYQREIFCLADEYEEGADRARAIRSCPCRLCERRRANLWK